LGGPKIQTQIEVLQKLWAGRPQDEQHRRPFYVGVGLRNLVPDHLHTLSLFSSLETESKRNRITSTIDALNQKYGTAPIFSASMLLARAAAPTRIAFTSIPDLF
jgi:DNA polymerase-4